MSFLAGRLAAKEGAYFLQESKQAVGRLASQKKLSHPLPSSSSSPSPEAGADMLPEVLRHSLPSKIFQDQSVSTSSQYSVSKWVLPSDSNNVSSVSADVLNPLRAYVSLPQVSFGPKRWQLPQAENSVSASTANELRQDRHTPISPQKLKAAAEGLAHIGKAFAAASALVFGGGALVLGLIVSNLKLQNTEDIHVKGKDLVKPKLERIKEQLAPLKVWADDMSKKWHLERKTDIKEKPIIKELSKVLGAKTSS